MDTALIYGVSVGSGTVCVSLQLRMPLTIAVQRSVASVASRNFSASLLRLRLAERKYLWTCAEFTTRLCNGPSSSSRHKVRVEYVQKYIFSYKYLLIYLSTFYEHIYGPQSHSKGSQSEIKLHAQVL